MTVQMQHKQMFHVADGSGWHYASTCRIWQDSCRLNHPMIKLKQSAKSSSVDILLKKNANNATFTSDLIHLQFNRSFWIYSKSKEHML